MSDQFLDVRRRAPGGGRRDRVDPQPAPRPDGQRPSRCRSPPRSWSRGTRSISLVQSALECLPDELRQARWLLREREEFMAERNREAEALMDDVRAQAEHMVQRTEIVRQANSVAQRILDDANEEARTLRHQAEDFVRHQAGRHGDRAGPADPDGPGGPGQAGRARRWTRAGRRGSRDGGGRLLRPGPVLMAAPTPSWCTWPACAATTGRPLHEVGGARWPRPARSTRPGIDPGRSVVPAGAEVEVDVILTALRGRDRRRGHRDGPLGRASAAAAPSRRRASCAFASTSGSSTTRWPGVRRGALPDRRRHHRPGAVGPRRRRARAAHGAAVPGRLRRAVPAVRRQPQRGRMRLRCPTRPPVG